MHRLHIRETYGTVSILGRKKATIDAAEANVDTPKQPNNRKPDPENDALFGSSIRAAQKIRVSPMTQVTVPVLACCQLSSLVYTEPKHAVFINHHLKLTNGNREIDPDKSFIVVVNNFSTARQKNPKYMLLRYATLSPKILIPVD